MGSETYYFMFSLIFVMGAALYLVNLILLRRRGKTTFGIVVKPGTPEYKRVIRLASNRNIAIAVIVGLVFIVNLAYDINRLLDLDNYPHGLMLYIAGFFMLMFIIMLPLAGRYARSISQLGAEKRKK